ncbi:piggyBac transposable element-derived protein 4-like [Ptychodera flava]|uniref:piggyBac transposable element-derived protein 4-like n=1 Tax=Ptychodera flava TaxID=63121 RepID=UPI00396A5B8A
MQQEIERRQEYYETSIAGGTVNRPYTDLRTGNFDLLPEFIGPEPGLINPLPDDASEVEWFLQIFDEDLIRFITQCTNRYARQRRRANARERQRSAWTPTTVVEMRAFIGVMVLFGICWQPEIRLYWSDHVCFGHNFVKRTFSRDRFKLLMRYLYYSTQPYCARNTAMYTAQKISEKRDRMLKVRNVIDRVNANSRMHRSPMCELAIDEGVIPYQGRTKNVLYNPAKPHKYGMRVYTLSESATGYVFNDEVHQPVADNCHHPLDPDAADNPRVFRGNRPGQVVSRLIRPYYELGHHVIMDSYYTSARCLTISTCIILLPREPAECTP